MTKSVLQVHEFAKALVEAGVLHEEDLNNISRVVIDADANSGLLQIHVTRIGDDPDVVVDKIAPVLRGIL